jgi:hypothetical protein
MTKFEFYRILTNYNNKYCSQMDLKSLFCLIPDPYTDPDLTFGKLIKNVLLGKILYFFNDELRKL